jgi:hypothetical protein
MTRHTKNSVGATTIILILLATVGAFWFTYYLPRRDFERLVAGDTEIEITSIAIVGQGQELAVTDAAALKYCAHAFRSALKMGYVPYLGKGDRIGNTYYADIGLGAARPVKVTCNVPDNVEGMNIGYPADGLGDPIYYWLELPQPVPPAVSATLARMRKS